MALIGRSIATIVSDELDIPVHLSTSLILVHQLGGNAVQVTLGDLSNLDSFITLDPKDIKRVLKIRQRHGFYMVVHGKYVYNFCRSDWSFKLTKSLLRELFLAQQINCDVIIHQGKNVTALKITREQAITNFVTGIKAVIEQMELQGLTNRILLENSAAQGNDLGYSLVELTTIWSMFTDQERLRLGFCIDTCHAFVAGELDFGQPEPIQTWMCRFDSLIGLEHIKVIHFNGSAIKFQGRNDRHAGITCENNHINLDGLKYLARFCANLGIPMILETPTHDAAGEIELIKDWINE